MQKNGEYPARDHVAMPRGRADRLHGIGDAWRWRDIYMPYNIVYRGPPCIRGQKINIPYSLYILYALISLIFAVWD